MRYLSLFSGIEAATVAWAPLGWECVGVSEIDPYGCAALAHHYPGVPNLGDITKITEADIAMLGGIDLVVFGSPCQNLSVAGKREGLNGSRSKLFFDAMQIVEWARTWGGCRFALWENVPGAFSSNKGADFAVVVGQMAGVECPEIPPKGWGTEGAIVGPQGMVEWSTLDAQWFGVAQRRRRVFAVADFGDWASRPPILLEPESLRGDTAPSREAGQGVAGTLASRTGAGGYPGSDEACDGHVIPVGLQRPVLTPEPARVQTHRNGRNAGGMDRIDAETETFIVTDAVSPTLLSGATSPASHGKKSGTDREALVVCVTGSVSHTLKADGFDASEDGTGRGTPIVPVVVGSLSCNTGPNGHDSGNFACNQAVDAGHVFPVLPFDTTPITSAANYSRPKDGDPCHPLAAGAHAPAIAFHHNAQACQLQGEGRDTSVSDPLTCSQQAAVTYTTKLHTTNSNQAGKLYPEYTTALDRSSPPPALLTAMQVRRLTPRECERLQAFPDGHTAITVRGKPAADGNRYKALGNSMCVNVMAWIGRQIDHVTLFY